MADLKSQNTFWNSGGVASLDLYHDLLAKVRERSVMDIDFLLCLLSKLDNSKTIFFYNTFTGN